MPVASEPLFSAAAPRRPRSRGGLAERTHPFQCDRWRTLLGASSQTPSCPLARACYDEARCVGPSCDSDAAGLVGASRHHTERLYDVTRNYDPSGGTGRFKSCRARHSPLDPHVLGQQGW